MANTNSPDGGGEKLQIAILTFFMTAGGFLLLTLVFTLFFNPRLDTRMKKAETEYKQLCALLQKEDVRRLRQQDRLNQEKGDEQGLRRLISENLSKYGLQFREFRPPRESTKKGVTEISQPITLLAASMTPILQFVAVVQASRKSIQVALFDMTRNKKRAAAGDDSWQASVTFVDYETSAPK